MTKRTKKQILKDKAWATFSKWIKNRDGNKCVTCGVVNDVMNGGHFWHNVLDYDEENINCQCQRCNHFLSGNLAVYSVYLLNKLGEVKFKELEKRHYEALKGEKHDIQYYQDIIDKYSLGEPENIK